MSNEKVRPRTLYKSYSLALEGVVKMESCLCVRGVEEFRVLFLFWVWWVDIVNVIQHPFPSCTDPRGRKNFPPLANELGRCVPGFLNGLVHVFSLPNGENLPAVRDNQKLEK